MRELVLIALVACGCGAFVPVEDHEKPPAHPEPIAASRPFTAEQVRAASPAGRWMRFRVTQAAGLGETVEYHFVDADADTATVVEVTTADGALEPARERHRRTWDELTPNPGADAASTQIARAHVQTPAGAFDCDEYVVHRMIGGTDLVTTLDFADAMPGPPIRTREVAGGATQTTMELVAFGVGGTAP